METTYLLIAIGGIAIVAYYMDKYHKKTFVKLDELHSEVTALKKLVEQLLNSGSTPSR